MKLRVKNLFLAGLAACTFVSCSKDEAIDNGPKEQVEAFLSITASARTIGESTDALRGPSTKQAQEVGHGDELGNESFINTLSAYVFRVPEGVTEESQMVLAGKKTEVLETAEWKNDRTGIIAISHILVKVNPSQDGKTSTDQFKVVLVANGVEVDVKTLADFKNATITKSIDQYDFTYTYPNADPSHPGHADFLPMVSEVLDISGLAPNVHSDGNNRENWVNHGNAGGITTSSEAEGMPSTQTVPPVALTRLVARVQVEGLFIDIKDNYPDAKFELQNISVVNVRPTSTFNGGNGNWVKGFESAGYSPADKWIYEGATNDWKTYQKSLSQSYQNFTGTGRWFLSMTADKFFAYAFSNKDADFKTALLISGKFYRAGDTKGEVRNFRVFLRDENKPMEVLPNHIYKLIVTITGEGSPNEDEVLLTAHVAATITVNDWKVINQDEETD